MINNKYKIGHRRKNRRLVYVTAIFVAIAVSGMGAYFYRQYYEVRPPAGANFGMWYPKHTADYDVDEKSLHFDPSSSTITFKLINKKEHNELMFTEQAVPESFAVAPQAFDQQVAGLRQVTKIDSINGTVALTRPFENGGVTAIMRSQGTIVYVFSGKELDNNTWLGIFNSLELYK